MHQGKFRPADAPPATVELRDFDGRDLRLKDQVQRGLNLFLTLKNPAQMPALLRALETLQPRTSEALRSLRYVHFARFLPARDGSALMVITVYDGELESYLMDFVANMGDVFTAILEFVRDAPRLPVARYPRDFCDFVRRNNVDQVQPWSAYPSMTVLDILHAQRPLR